jgi:hypothetical protein
MPSQKPPYPANAKYFMQCALCKGAFTLEAEMPPRQLSLLRPVATVKAMEVTKWPELVVKSPVKRGRESCRS